MQIEEIKSVLADRLTQFRDQNPEKHSYAYISNRTDVGPKYIERAAKNQLGSEVDSKKVLELAKFVCDPKETQEIADFFAGRLLEESSILKDAIFAKFVQQNGYNDVTTEMDEVLRVEDAYVVYCLCAKSSGSTEEQISSILGKTGVDALYTLISKGIVRKEGNTFITINSKFSHSFEHLNSVFQILARMYKPKNVGKERNYAHVVSHGLTREGIKRLQSEHRRHHEEVRKIRDEFEGDIDTFSVGFMDTFTSEDIDSVNFNKSTKDKAMNGITKTLMSLLVFVFSFSFSPKTDASEIVMEVKGQFKKALETNFESFKGPNDQIIKIKDLDLIRALEIDGKFELDSGLTLDGTDFNFRDFTPVKRVLVGGGDTGGG